MTPVLRSLPIVLSFLAPLGAAEVVLIEGGKARSAIHVPASVMTDDRVPSPSDTLSVMEAEKNRQRLRESVKDLSRALEKMSGVRLEILTTPPADGDARLPILIGDMAVRAFGAVEKTDTYKQGLRVVVEGDRVGLLGESDLGTSYAIYEILDRLGCRWFIPGETGEVIPERKAVRVDECDDVLEPGTLYRGVWYADDAYRRRNRLGGFLLQAGHALEMYVSEEQRNAHPEWRGIVGGKPSPRRLKWSNPRVADAIADRILAAQEKSPVVSYSLSPDDGMDFCESAEDRAVDAGDWDEGFGQVSITDRLMVLCNRIVGKVSAPHPDLLFGMLAYSQYVRPPVREKVPRNLIPQLAPITYSRAHPMTDERVPGNETLRYSVEGWGRAANAVSYYLYGWFLAETTAPNPMITKWSVDLPIIYENNCRFWQPETIPNFETSMHALYLGIRMAWNPRTRPSDIVRDINTRFYGNAAQAMESYWNFMDGVWVNTPEYSGCGFAYRRRFTPGVMKEARRLMDGALAACRTPMEKRRVEMAGESLKLFEQFMKSREDLASGRFAGLEADGSRWRDGQKAMSERYKDEWAFGSHSVFGNATPIGIVYFDSFYAATYKDASRIATDFQILTVPPLGPFRFRIDRENTGESQGWQRPDFDDQAWKPADPSRDSLSALGHHDYFGRMWYRTATRIPATPKGKRVWLWVGATDGSAKVFVNGSHVPFVSSKGEKSDQAEGYCQPFSWDITEVIKPDVENQITILCNRTGFNELGTGGLLAPVVLYREKD